MSSFKRKSSSSSQSKRLPGVRPSPSSASVLITSTGVPSLDDILGGGLQLSTSLLVLNPDPHSAHGDLLQKYFIAQGLASGQDVCVISQNADNLVENCMWTQKPSEDSTKSQSRSVDNDEELNPSDDAIKIAWRYESMQKFQTTVESPASSAQEEYCRQLDLTCQIPLDIVRSSKTSGQLLCLDLASTNYDDPYDALLVFIEEALRRTSDRANEGCKVFRLSIPSLGSPFWGDPIPEKILRFLHGLRSALRTSTNACALLTLPSHVCSDTYGGPGWVQKLGWMSDSCIDLDSFTADPFMSSLFPSYHGLLRIHKLSNLYTLVPPSDRFSTLRGLSSASSSSSSGGVGENNLAFKVTRKRFLFETLHLDLEGGINERRTTPLPSASALANDDHQHQSSVPAHPDNTPVISIGFEDHSKGSPVLGIQAGDNLRNDAKPPKAKKPKKRVGFLADRPDLYDF